MNTARLPAACAYATTTEPIPGITQIDLGASSIAIAGPHRHEIAETVVYALDPRNAPEAQIEAALEGQECTLELAHEEALDKLKEEHAVQVDALTEERSVLRNAVANLEEQIGDAVCILGCIEAPENATKVTVADMLRSIQEAVSALTGNMASRDRSRP